MIQEHFSGEKAEKNPEERDALDGLDFKHADDETVSGTVPLSLSREQKKIRKKTIQIM